MIYLDHMASTPLDPEARAAMLEWLDPARAGNPHAEHPAGWAAARAVEAARAEVAALIGGRPGEIVFTSGATEANNLAIAGLAGRIEHVVTSAVEHASVLQPVQRLKQAGKHVTVLPPDWHGAVDPEALDAVLDGRPALVSLMLANNETGAMQALSQVAEVCRRHGAILHSDAAQIAGVYPRFDVAESGVDLLTLSAHKLYGPQGIGALWVRAGLGIEPQLFGGGQQAGRRPGTLPVALCAGFGAACRVVRAWRATDEILRVTALCRRLHAALERAIPQTRENGPLFGHAFCLNVTLPGVDAAELLLDLPNLAVSTGAACSANDGRPSHVLRAMGHSPEDIQGSLRFGLGRGTTEAEVDAAAAMIVDAVYRIPGYVPRSPFYLGER